MLADEFYGIGSAWLPRLQQPTGTDASLNVRNDFGNNVPYSAYLEAFSQIRAPVVFPTAAPNLEPRNDIWPTETAPVFRRREEGVELVQLDTSKNLAVLVGLWFDETGFALGDANAGSDWVF